MTDPTPPPQVETPTDAEFLRAEEQARIWLHNAKTIALPAPDNLARCYLSLARCYLSLRSKLLAAEDRIAELERERETARADAPYDIRASGWVVAVHNDYHLNGVLHTFWLFTKGDRAVKGEGQSDLDALNQVRAALDQIEAK